MMLPDKYGVRLNTKHFRKVKSHAALNIDYYEKLRIAEIEFVGNEVYHYLSTNNKEWNKLIEISNKGKGLGAYINQVFKKKHDYYKLIVISDK
jgi:ADP-heptose:LPS heptosyltransferase